MQIIVFLSMDNMYSTIGENMRYFMYKYKFSTNDWYRPLSFLNNKINTYVNSTVNFDIVCTATAIKELCQARDMGDTQFFNRQEFTINENDNGNDNDNDNENVLFSHQT